jgi:hypothetical protein
MLQQALAAFCHSRLRLRASTGQRRQHFEITANIGFLLGPRPAFDAPLGSDGFVDSFVAFCMYERYRPPSESISLVKPQGMLTEPLFNGTARDSGVVAPVRAAEDVDRCAAQGA